MLDRIHDEIYFECDDCGETLETETKDFSAANERRTHAKWTAFRVGKEWQHFCPDCYRKNRVA